MSEVLGLVRYDAMCTAIADCVSVDEVKEIRDRARAFEMYAKQALNTEAECKAGQIRMRAERRGGQLLTEMKASGQRESPGGDRRSKSDGATLKSKSDGATSKVMLSDLGVTRDQSSQWQQLAAIPEREFEAEVSKPGPKPTAHGLLANRTPKVEQTPRMDPRALEAWAWITGFRDNKFGGTLPTQLFGQMTDSMRDDVAILGPKLIAWLEEFGEIEWKPQKKLRA